MRNAQHAEPIIECCPLAPTLPLVCSGQALPRRPQLQSLRCSKIAHYSWTCSPGSTDRCLDAHTPQCCFNIPGFALRLDEGAALWKIHCGGWCGICHGCGILWHTLAYSGSLAYAYIRCGCFCVLVSYQPIYLAQKALTHSDYFNWCAQIKVFPCWKEVCRRQLGMKTLWEFARHHPPSALMGPTAPPTHQHKQSPKLSKEHWPFNQKKTSKLESEASNPIYCPRQGLN